MILIQSIIFTEPLPSECPCEWAQAALRSLAAETRSKWSGGSGKRSPSHCHSYGPACSGDSYRSLGPSTPEKHTKRQIMFKVSCTACFITHLKKRRRTRYDMSLFCIKIITLFQMFPTIFKPREICNLNESSFQCVARQWCYIHFVARNLSKFDFFQYTF